MHVYKNLSKFDKNEFKIGLEFKKRKKKMILNLLFNEWNEWKGILGISL